MWFWMLNVFVDTSTGNQRGPPSTRFARAERLHPSGVRLRSARSAEPRRGEDGRNKDNLQKQAYTGLWGQVAVVLPFLLGIALAQAAHAPASPASSPMKNPSCA
jgi:hypothetical protein